jgi:hypothetical protein
MRERKMKTKILAFPSTGGNMKKFISLVLVFSIFALSGNMFAEERRGADIIDKTDGGKVEGELIAVKENSLLLKLSYSSFDVSVDIEDVKIVTVKKESKAAIGANFGFLIGGSIGALGAAKCKGWGCGTTRAITISGILFGLFGGIIGGGVGEGIEGKERTVFEGKSDAEIQKILSKLRKKARVKNYS